MLFRSAVNGANNTGCAIAQPVLFAPFTARAVDLPMSLQLIAQPGTASDAVADSVSLPLSIEVAPNASELVTVLSQRFGPVSVQCDDDGLRNKRRRTVLKVDSIRARITLDAERGETNIECDATPAIRQGLLDTLQQVGKNTKPTYDK